MVKYPKHIADTFMREPWPLSYDGFDFQVKVIEMDEEHHISAGTRERPLDHRKAYRAIFRLLNEIVWFHHATATFESGSHSMHHIEVTYKVDTERYLGEFKQQVFEDRQHLVLGLYRDATSYDSPYFRFSCLWRILEVPFATAKARTEWLAEATGRLSKGMIEAQCPHVG